MSLPELLEVGSYLLGAVVVGAGGAWTVSRLLARGETVRLKAEIKRLETALDRAVEAAQKPTDLLTQFRNVIFLVGRRCTRREYGKVLSILEVVHQLLSYLRAYEDAQHMEDPREAILRLTPSGLTYWQETVRRSIGVFDAHPLLCEVREYLRDLVGRPGLSDQCVRDAKSLIRLYDNILSPESGGDGGAERERRNPNADRLSDDHLGGGDSESPPGAGPDQDGGLPGGGVRPES